MVHTIDTINVQISILNSFFEGGGTSKLLEDTCVLFIYTTVLYQIRSKRKSINHFFSS